MYCVFFFTRLKNKKYKTLVLQSTALTGKTSADGRWGKEGLNLSCHVAFSHFILKMNCRVQSFFVNV